MKIVAYFRSREEAERYAAEHGIESYSVQHNSEGWQSHPWVLINTAPQVALLKEAK